MQLRRVFLLFVLFFSAQSAWSQDPCAVVVGMLAGTQGVQCVASEDLTTANPATTPEDNSRGLPPNAFTPRTDRAAVSPDDPKRTPITRAVRGLQITGGMADDANARWLLRLPYDWNGKVVVGVPGGTRSEFMGDYIFSDLVVQQGYAYASTNKGALNFFFTTPADPAGCRLTQPTHPALTGFRVHFYLADKEDTITEWFGRTQQATALARTAVQAMHSRAAERTYLVGISNGGHVVRRLLEESPELYDGGLDWEGVYWAPPGPNILIDLPAALRPYRDYFLGGFNPASAAHEAIVDAGYPPDIRSQPLTPTLFGPNGSFWETHANNYWDVTTCLFAKELDPAYTGLPENYDYLARRKPFKLSNDIGRISTGGDIARPLLTVHGTMDALLPLTRHARAFRDAVIESGKGGLHRLYEVQNGNHIERFSQSAFNFRQLELIQPHAHDAFARLTRWVEGGVVPPPSQCVPRGGAIADHPDAAARPERCAALLVP